MSFVITFLQPPTTGRPEPDNDIFTEITFDHASDLMAFLPNEGEVLKLQVNRSGDQQVFGVSKVRVVKGIRPPPRGKVGEGNYVPYIHAVVALSH